VAALTLFEGKYLRAEVVNPEAQVLFVSFDRWRKDRAGFHVWEPSQKLAEQGFAELTIRPARNDWYMNPDLPALRAVLEPFTARYAEVRSFSFSMGAYGALLLSASLHLRHAVLISPQWSIYPDEAPFETRYRREAKAVGRRFGELAGMMTRDLRGVILFDPLGEPRDAAHAHLIAEAAPGLRCVAMGFTGHPATSVLLETVHYKSLRALAFAGSCDAAAYAALHRKARLVSPLYKQRLAAYLARRTSRTGNPTP